MPDSPYLIVGQGIAGTSLAWHLLARGRKFLIIDDPALPSSSYVAAGIFNPLTGRKLVKTWMADTIFPYAAGFYSRIGKVLGARFVHPADIYRPYRGPDEKERYLRWAEESGYQDYISPGQVDLSGSSFINAPHGGLTISRSGWIDLPHFLDCSRTYFKEAGCFREAHFSPADLTLEANGAAWNGMHFEKIVNCMGTGAEKDPLFNWLPFNPVKGQVLECRVDGYPVEQIVNQGIFILPLPDGRVKVGATYSWHDLDWETTPEARDYLSGKLAGLLKAPFSVTRQLAGIRPSSQDRRPFAGRHPEHEQLYIFNGLGTKGVTLAPFFAGQMADLLSGKEELHPEVNIRRYFSLYSKPRMS